MLAPPSNARLKAVRRLRRRTVREHFQEFLAEGPQVVREALGAGAAGRVLDVFVAESELERHRAIVDDALAAGVPVHLSPDAGDRQPVGHHDPPRSDRALSLRSVATRGR